VQRPILRADIVADELATLDRRGTALSRWFGAGSVAVYLMFRWARASGLLAVLGLCLVRCGEAGDRAGRSAASGSAGTSSSPTDAARPERGGGASVDAGGASLSIAEGCGEGATVLGGGFVRCENGLLHRPAPAECSSSLPRPDPLPFLLEFPEYGAIDGSGELCKTDRQCTAQPNGYCEIVPYGLSLPACLYGCVRDADCEGPGQMCFCGDPVGHCVTARCRMDEDCGSGLYCASYVEDPECAPIAFACQSPEDECVTDADCPSARCVVERGRRLCKPAFDGCISN
jgi:hypothetical protein